MRIGFVTQWYDPELDSSTYSGVIARALVAQGHEVHVLTGFPNYPTGRLAPGYPLRPYRYELLRGVHVHRAPLLPSHDRNAVRRAGNYLSFATCASVTAARVLRGLDVTLVYSSPATAALPAMTARRVLGVPYVLLIQDLWPSSVVDSGLLDAHRAARVERALHTFCDATYRSAAAIAVIAPSMADAIRARGVPAERIRWVPNWADEAVFTPRPRDPELAAQLGITRPKNLMYAGNLGEFQNVRVLIETARRLRSRADVGVVVAGRGVLEEELRRVVAEDALDNVIFVGAIGPDRIADVLALGDLQVVALADLPLFRMTLPSKLQATMAAGRPILAALPGDGARIVAEAGCGVIVPPDDPDAWAAAALSRLDDPQTSAAEAASGRRWYDAHFAQRIGVERLTELLAGAARHRRATDRVP